MVNKRNRSLIREYGGKVMPFRDLPIPAQLAMAHYMAIDGEAWQLPEGTGNWSVSRVKKELPDLLPYFRKTYGGKRFGYVMIPMEAMKESILNDPYLIEDYGVFDSYEAYDELIHDSPGHRATKHPTTDRWPVILSSQDDETLQDGWHRLDAYYHQGARTITALFYP